MRSVLAATAALILVPLSQATGSRPALPSCDDDFTPFVDQGCYDGSLVHRSSQDQSKMTIEICVAECKGNGFRYAGLQYYGVCYCGSEILDGEKVDDSQCNQACSGDKSETCGSNNMLSIWEDPTFAYGPDDVTAEDYESLGCYPDDNNSLGRTLNYPISLAADTFTPEACIDACREEGFAYAGTEYGSECWCGATLPSDVSEVDASQCSVACKGDSTQQCGGSLKIDLYYAEKLGSSEPCGYEPPAQTTTTTTTISTTSTTSTSSTSTTTTVITTAPPTTTTDKATTTATLCTATVTSTPKCEYSCGSWCAPALPDWDNQSDCVSAAKTCALQVASCFKTAGWPAAIQCFEFSKWCVDIKDYCSSDCRGSKCGKTDCWNKNKPSGSLGSTTTTVFPCPATSTMKTTTAKPTTTVCPPAPTNICTQPTNSKYGYSPEEPVAGIELPVVSCNDIKDDWSKNPFKLYTSSNSRNCPSFSWNQRPDVCQDACEEQYEDCKETYVNSCGNLSWKNNHHKRAAGESVEQFERRTYNSHNGDKDDNDYSNCAVSDTSREWCKSGSDAVKCWGRGANNANSASNRCKAQYKDCLAVNKKVSPGNQCKSWCDSKK